MTTDNNDFNEQDLDDIVERGIQRSRARRQPPPQDQPVDEDSFTARFQRAADQRNGSTAQR